MADLPPPTTFLWIGQEDPRRCRAQHGHFGQCQGTAGHPGDHGATVEIVSVMNGERTAACATWKEPHPRG